VQEKRLEIMIKTAHIEALVYPTENIEKVIKAFYFVSGLKPKRENLEDIVKLSAETKKKKEIESIVKKIKKQKVDIKDHMDEEGNFYLRFDKGTASENKLVKTNSGYAIKVVLKFVSYPRDLEKIQKEILTTIG
jgi:RNA binding exosome subunit